MMRALETWFRDTRGHRDQDAMQEAIARYLEFQSAGGVVRNTIAFLEGTLRNVNREAHRYSKRFQQAGDLGEIAMSADSSEGAQENMDARLEQLLSTLSPKERNFLRTYFSCKRGKDRKELAARLRVSENGLYARVHRLKRKLEKAAAEIEDSHDG